MERPTPQDRKVAGPEGTARRTSPSPGGRKACRSDTSPQRPKINWRRFVVTLVFAYAVIFLISSFFDEKSPEPISYTQFTQQVQAGNVKEIYATGTSIQGNLKKTARDPDSQNKAYTMFSTEMPVFANQQQLYQQLTRTGTEIKAEPVSNGGASSGTSCCPCCPWRCWPACGSGSCGARPVR